MDELFVIFGLGIASIAILFIGLPWLIFHYVTRWKTQATLTRDDERMIDELYNLAHRLEARVVSVERILTAEDPEWRNLAGGTRTTRIEEERNVR